MRRPLLVVAAVVVVAGGVSYARAALPVAGDAGPADGAAGAAEHTTVEDGRRVDARHDLEGFACSYDTDGGSRRSPPGSRPPSR